VLLLAGGCARGQCVEQVRVERSTAVRHYRAVNVRETKSRRRVSAVRDPCRAASRAVRGASALGAARWTGASATAMQWQVRRRRWENNSSKGASLEVPVCSVSTRKGGCSHARSGIWANRGPGGMDAPAKMDSGWARPSPPLALPPQLVTGARRYDAWQSIHARLCRISTWPDTIS
jgi:hypothetical protein